MRIVIAVCISLISSMAFVPAWAEVLSPTVEEDIRVEERSFRLVFGGHRFFPGQKITIKVRQTIDAHHEYWEVRECSWFGAKCWYEPRESATIVNTSTFPVLLSVKDMQGKELSSLDQTIDQAVSDSPVRHVPLPPKWEADQEFPLALEIQDSDREWKIFGAPIQVFARIADRGAGKMPLHYNSCDGRPRHCGRGSYRITVLKIDNTERMKKLEVLLQSQLPPSTVISTLKQDRFLVSDPDHNFRKQLARLLFNQSQLHSNADAQQEYLQFALEVDRSLASVDISNALSKAYLDSGNIQSAKVENEKTFQVISGEYASAKSAGALTIKLVSEYYKALKTAARIGSVERGGIYSGDLIKATGVYIEASRIADEGRCLLGVGRKDQDNCLPPADQGKRKEWNLLTQMAYEARVDASRLLMMMRSHENMVQAERLLGDAVTLAQQLVTN